MVSIVNKMNRNIENIRWTTLAKRRKKENKKKEDKIVHAITTLKLTLHE